MYPVLLGQLRGVIIEMSADRIPAVSVQTASFERSAPSRADYSYTS